MSSNYQVIVEQNLKAIFADDLEERAEAMAAVWNGQFLSFNAFMPVDGLADVGEYTSKAILDLIG